MPFGPYDDFKDCVSKNQDKASPEGFCAWLHKEITGKYPSESSSSMPPDAFQLFIPKYSEALDSGKGEKEAYAFAVKEGLTPAGWVDTRQGWAKLYQAPKMRVVEHVPVFSTGEHTNSAGKNRKWAEVDLDKMVEAFVAGVPAVSPLKCGHTPDSFNRKIAEALGVPVDVVTGLGGKGQIALGRMSSLERKGNLLIAAYERVPEPIAKLIEAGLYSNVSVEIEDKIGDYGPVITATALLGVEEPAIEDATLARSAVFGGPREGALVYTFSVAKDLPSDILSKELTDVKARFEDIIKGKRGAPVFRAMFGTLYSMYERIIGSGHQTGTADVIPEEVFTLAASEHQGNIDALINWAGEVGFDQCVTSLTGKPGIDDPARVCGWLKARAEHGKKTNEEVRMSKFSEIKAKFQGPGAPAEGTEAAAALMAIAQTLGLTGEVTVEDVIKAIKALAEKAGATAPAAMSAEFSKMGETIKSQGDTIAVLQHQARVEKYQKETSVLTAIQGKPAELAAKLATLEEKSGEATAKEVLSTYQEANKAAQAAIQARGTSRSGVKAAAFEDKVQEFMKADPKLNRGDATRKAMNAYPELYRDVKTDAHAGASIV